MRPVLGLILGSLCIPGSHAADLEGTYVLKTRGGQLVTRVQVSGQTLNGVIEVPDGPPVRLSGTANNNRAQGVARSARGNGQFHAQLVGDRLDMVISQEAGPRQQAMQLPLQFHRAQ